MRGKLLFFLGKILFKYCFREKAAHPLTATRLGAADRSMPVLREAVHAHTACLRRAHHRCEKSSVDNYILCFHAACNFFFGMRPM